MDFGLIQSLIPIILIIGVFYFLMIMPQQKKIKKHQNMLKNLSKGDEVVTEGGIYGTIVGLKDNVVVLKIAEVKDEDVKIEVSRARVAFLVRSGELVEGTDA